MCGTRSLPGTRGPAASPHHCLCGKWPQPGPAWVYATNFFSRTGRTSHTIRRTAWCFAVTEKACMLVLQRELPFRRQTAPEGLWVGRCLSKHSLSHHQLCLAVRVFLQHGNLSPCLPPPSPKKSTRQLRKQVASTVTTDATRSGTRPTSSLSKCSANPTHEHHQHLRDAQPPLREGLLIRPC